MVHSSMPLRGKRQGRPAEDHPSPGDSFARYGHNLLPVDEKRKSRPRDLHYPIPTRVRPGTGKTARRMDACHGLKLNSPIRDRRICDPTIGTFIQLLRRVSNRTLSSTTRRVHAIEGKGRSRSASRPSNGVARPVCGASWQWVTHEADADSVLSASRTARAQKLDLFREDRGMREGLRLYH